MFLLLRIEFRSFLAYIRDSIENRAMSEETSSMKPGIFDGPTPTRDSYGQ